jgi:hypothetical protein
MGRGEAVGLPIFLLLMGLLGFQVGAVAGLNPGVFLFHG